VIDQRLTAGELYELRRGGFLEEILLIVSLPIMRLWEGGTLTEGKGVL